MKTFQTKALALALTLALCGFARARAQALHVSVFGSDDNAGTANSPLRNIQTALARATNGDTIKVAAGTFSVGTLTPQSQVLLLGGYTEDFLERDIFTGQTVLQASSAAMLVDRYSCTIDGFVFDGNGVAGIGLDLESASKVAHNVVLRIQESLGYGVRISSGALLVNNTFYGCTRSIDVTTGQAFRAVIKNNVVTHGSFGMTGSAGNSLVSYNNVFGNSINYSGQSPGAGDISADPQYLDAAAEDFRVKAASPTLDAGDPADSFGEEPEPNGGRIDMGAYGGTKSATAKVLAPILSSPPDRATNQAHTPMLAWQPSLAATSYHLQIATEPSFSAAQTIFNDSTLTATAAQVGPLAMNTTYYWRVRARNLFGAGNYSNVFRFTTSNLAAPAAPQNLQAVPGDRQITLTWSANLEADFLRYRIYGGMASNPVAVLDSAEGISNTAKTLTGLTNGVTHFYRITAVNHALLESGYSNEVSATPRAGQPPAIISAGASEVRSASARLSGTVNPNGLSTSIKFQYGLSASYGNEVAATPGPISGSANVAVQAELMSLSPNTLYHYRVAAENSAGSTFGNDNTFTTLANQAPVIVATPLAAQFAGQAITVSANITDDFGVASAALSFRQGGEINFTVVAMPANGDVYQGLIPGSSVASRGVEYFITATDANSASSRQPNTGVFAVRVRSASLVKSEAQPGGSSQSAYRLFSVPLDLDDKNAATVLEDDLGKYDDTEWRFSELRPDYLNVSPEQQHTEFPNTSMLAPGKAFWLLVKAPGRFIDTEAGVSNVTNEVFAMPLHLGWNYMGNPFHFDIPFARLELASGQGLDMRFYDGAWSTFATAMKPFEGFAVFNGNASLDTLLINASASGAQTIIPPLRGVSFGISTNGKTDYVIAANTPLAPLNGGITGALWSIQILAQCQQARDVDNVIAIVPNASREYDGYDRPEPPVVGEYVSVYFPHWEWPSASPAYCVDARPEFAEGEVWEFEVATNIRDQVRLIFTGAAQAPEEFEVRLMDEALSLTQDLREKAVFIFAGSPPDHPKSLKLMIGRQDFIAAQLAESMRTSIAFELSQNFPNPFNPVTTIRYGLPHAERVTLQVFNVLGEEVAALVSNETKPPGYHTAIWDGRDRNGRQAASGVYVYRLRSGTVTLTKKIALVR